MKPPFRDKTEILSTHNLLCQKFPAVCWKTAIAALPTFLTNDVAELL